MTNDQTIEKLYDLSLGAMAEAFRGDARPLRRPGALLRRALGPAGRARVVRREENRLARRLKAAR